MMCFKTKLENYIDEINGYLHFQFDEKQGLAYDAMRYSLFAGGKRIRPVLSLAVCDALNGDHNAALCFGSAIEMIHTYSLIHDDLPCMDNDDLRRGKPTNHIVFGEDMAVLAGDALLNFACESVVSSSVKDDSVKIKALNTIFHASGVEGMIGGQVMDMQAEGKSVDEEYLKILHKKKTGALIKAAVKLGQISAKTDYKEFDVYASSLGLAFQIRDDILDVEGDAEKFGKPILSDEKNEKTTYVSLYGVDGAKVLLKDETEKAISSLAFLGDKAEFLRDIAIHLLNREN